MSNIKKAANELNTKAAFIPNKDNKEKALNIIELYKSRYIRNKRSADNMITKLAAANTNKKLATIKTQYDTYLRKLNIKYILNIQ